MPSDTSDNRLPGDQDQPTIPTPTPATPTPPVPITPHTPHTPHTPQVPPTPAFGLPAPVAPQTPPAPQTPAPVDELPTRPTPAAPILPPTPAPSPQAIPPYQTYQTYQAPAQTAQAQTAPKPQHRLRALLFGALIVVILAPLLAGGIWLRVHTAPGGSSGPSATHGAARGSFPWSNATRTTAPTSQYAIFAQQNNPVDPAFKAYYGRVNGPTLLGPALTPAYPTHLGWLQIFANGALIAPTQATQSSQAATPTQTTSATPDATASATATTAPTPAVAATPGDLDPALLRAGQLDVTTGVVRLPLLDTLLVVGSKIPVGGDDSAITYVTLRNATATDKLAHQSLGQSAQVSATITTASGVFIAESVSKGVASGHVIPTAVWKYITDSSVSPGGWQDFFGVPLTEALPTTATINGATHHLLAQAFTLASVAIDLDADASDDGAPAGMVLPLGRDYLETLGPPGVVMAAGTNGWLTGDTAIVNAPGGSSASAHLGLNFPLSLDGKTQWLNGALWYEATWQSPHRNGSGWAPASNVTINAPAKDAPAWASFDALAPSIATYLASFGNNVGSVVYDLTRNRYYAYNQNTPFVLASSSKVSIMVSYLWWLESQGRGPDPSENTTLTNMIEHSDNNAAQLLFDRLGGSAGQAAFYQRIGVTGYVANPYGWGWASLPPIGQVTVLTLLQEGKILTAKDRAYALNLMTHIEPDQHMGVGETLPPGATVAMKDGWVPAPDGLWAINTSGIVTVGSETYIIVVYTAHQSDYNGGWNITRTVCKAVGQAIV